MCPVNQLIETEINHARAPNAPGMVCLPTFTVYKQMPKCKQIYQAWLAVDGTYGFKRGLLWVYTTKNKG